MRQGPYMFAFRRNHFFILILKNFCLPKVNFPVTLKDLVTLDPSVPRGLATNQRC